MPGTHGCQANRSFSLSEDLEALGQLFFLQPKQLNLCLEHQPIRHREVDRVTLNRTVLPQKSRPPPPPLNLAQVTRGYWCINITKQLALLNTSVFSTQYLHYVIKLIFKPFLAKVIQLTAVEPFLTASCAYSTWKRWPSGEKTVIARSYEPPDMPQIEQGLKIKFFYTNFAKISPPREKVKWVCKRT